ncbi:MAG: group II intron reverse transcriptase domain-containing protein [Candidatus Terrybacteria bacterium]|nr:group II intron reverse transcriptase domain-containing protein [Candidatus Terrybacteria bacterium]
MDALSRERERERGRLRHIFNNIISVENLLVSWQEFLRGKRKRKDVAEFSLNFMDNILTLHSDLTSRTYIHGGYEAFKINDPKPRDIHKASVRDRLLHRAIYRILYPFFDRKFIADSFSCRLGKGTHKAINRFRNFSYKVGKNNTKTCWILKCDIRKFFANIDHEILINILHEHIEDENLIKLLKNIIGSFSSNQKGIGLPLGNLTSQLFVNIYMNKFDQFAKHKLKVKHYIRYCDDFVIFSESKDYAQKLIPPVKEFLNKELKLELHSKKVSIKTISSGVDFLGWVNFPNHRILRTTTKRKMFRNIKKNGGKAETIQSYLGLIGWGNSYKLKVNMLKKSVLLYN